VERWSPPHAGWHKVNSDGAFPQGQCHGGDGVIVRDHHGDFIAGACHFFPIVTDPEREELLACQRAVKLALEAGVRRLLLETDSASAVTKIGGRYKDRSVHGPLVEDIKDLLQGFVSASFLFVM
jgi:ribonuclease HI